MPPYRPNRPDDDRERWCFASVDELGAAYRSGRTTPTEVLEAVLGRVARHNDRLVAYYALCADDARRAAAAADARWAAGRPCGPLDGVPVSIKDHLDVAGMTGPRGRSPVGARPAAGDSPVTARLREAGAVVVGKTTMPELPVIPDTATAAFGATRNPIDPDRSSGGSSGGAATAVAAGLCTIAIGSDGGGSIRLPAAFTGTVGHKPTLGRVPYDPGQTDRTVAGPIARTVRDVAHAMNAIARPDGRDWMELPADPVDYLATLDTDLRGRTIGYAPDYGRIAVEPEVARLVEAAVHRLAERGARIVPVESPCEDGYMHWMVQAAIRFFGEAPPPGSPNAVASVYRYAQGLTVVDVQRMLDARNRIGAQLLAVLRRCDAVVSPTVPIVAPRVGTVYPDRDTLSEANGRMLAFTCPWNLVHMPAVSVPCGTTSEGLPAGLQVAGPKFSDARLLGIAAAVEAATT